MENALWYSSLVLPEDQQLPVTVRICGWEENMPGHAFGPYIRNYYLIHCVTKGRGIFQSHGKTYHLSAGEGFLIQPHESTFYQASDEDPWEYYWVGWEGDYARNIVQSLRFKEDAAVFCCPDTNQLKKAFAQLFACYQDEYQPYKLLGCFYSLVSLLAEKRGKQNEYLTKALSFIRDNYASNITVEDIARQVSISSTHLNRLMKTHFDMSTWQYLIHFRLSKATRLLESDELTLSEIAAACGFGDLAHFSNTFKSKTGKSPMQYRQANKNKYRN